MCKQLNIGLFAILLLVAMVGCSVDDSLLDDIADEPGKEQNDTVKTSVLVADTLRILDIGNSYTEDYTYNLAAIAKNLGGDLKHICYYNLVRASGSFKSWYDCYKGKDNIKYYCQKVLGNIDQDIPTGNFEPYDSEPLHKVLSQPWDLIVLHQVSNYSTDYEQWGKLKDGGYLDELLHLLQRLQPNAHFAFVLTHSYEHTNKNNTEKSTVLRWTHIAEASRKLMESYPAFEYLIPYGTAIENLRAVANNEHDLTRDGTHLGRGLARYTAALAVYQTLFNPRTGKNITDCNMTYTCQQWEIDGSKYVDGCVDVTPDNMPLAIESAWKACETPYALFR